MFRLRFVLVMLASMTAFGQLTSAAVMRVHGAQPDPQGEWNRVPFVGFPEGGGETLGDFPVGGAIGEGFSAGLGEGGEFFGNWVSGFEGIVDHWITIHKPALKKSLRHAF